MRKIILLLTLLNFQVYLNAQESFQDYVTMGEFNVEYTDTIIFDDSLEYEFMDYKGSAPLFVQIWCPSIVVPVQKMTFGDYRKMEVPDDLKQVHKHLELKKDSASIWYHVEKDFVQYQDIKYKVSHQEVFNRFKELPVYSYKGNEVPNPNFPVIVYHHGAQGHSDENYVMAEYFASRGYVFISANFHLPVEGKTYGSQIKWGMGYNQTSPKRLIEFAKEITHGNDCFFIGHSMGAQTGYAFLRTKEDVEAFVCMETTAEGRTQEKLEDMWSDMYATLKRDSSKYELPILHLASMERESKLNFYPFTMLHNADLIFMQSKKPFGHESYTSSYLMRYLFRKEFKMPDDKEMKEQLELYNEHLKLIFDYISSHENFRPEKYEGLFYLMKNEPFDGAQGPR